MTNKTEQVSVSLPTEILEMIEAARGDVPRSAFVRRLILQGLQEKGGKKK